MVAQGPVLFDCSVSENIRFGCDASEVGYQFDFAPLISRCSGAEQKGEKSCERGEALALKLIPMRNPGNSGLLVDEWFLNNILFQEEIVAAAKTANAHNFILGLERGYDATCGEKGAQMSGEQSHSRTEMKLQCQNIVFTSECYHYFHSEYEVEIVLRFRNLSNAKIVL